ncbi:MAG: hypothetical protein ACE5K4_01400 [Candidatus Hydrothermarchaeota archaeon]
MKENLRREIIIGLLRLFKVIEDVPEYLSWVGYYSFVEDIAFKRADYLLNKVILLFLSGIFMASIGYKSNKLILIIVSCFFILIGGFLLINPFEKLGSISKFEIDIEKKVDRIFGLAFLIFGLIQVLLFVL